MEFAHHPVLVTDVARHGPRFVLTEFITTAVLFAGCAVWIAATGVANSRLGLTSGVAVAFFTGLFLVPGSFAATLRSIPT